MYIHLGNNYVIAARDIIAILNIEKPYSNDIKEILEIAELDKNLVNIGYNGKEKSMVICDDKVYLSPISSNTLHKRALSDCGEVQYFE
ncbi:MAG: DUF370 domain-containing protein [Syntrophomonadaceae bacterium]|nr:DUF370 domain-containing protein [Syntrophomonadaceae bacterium]MDD4548477.1 DUF370 domain-containing protein [Syntrophomonadaceae bacterium]